MAAAAGWWLAAVELMPAADRPYIGGSQNNSILELTLGYNGLGRLNGDETGSVGGGNGWGTPGLFRLFNSEFGGQIAWLLPSVLVLGAGLLWLGRRAPRTDAVRASVIIWGAWVAVTGLTFSFMAGIIHPYYMVALAPGIAGLAGLGGVLLWQRRDQPVAAAVLAGAVVAGAVMGSELLGRTATFVPWLRWVVLLGSLAAACLILAAPRSGGQWRRPGSWRGRRRCSPSRPPLPDRWRTHCRRRPAAHSGSIVSAGPAASGRGGAGLPRAFGGTTGMNGAAPNGTAANGTGANGAGAGRGPGAGGAAGMGGLLGASTPSAALVTALQTDAGNFTWTAAVVGSNNAAGYQLATELPVMAVGGFNGTDPAPTLAQFQQYVADGKIHYFIAGR